ncbi:MAG: hypothetical protein WEA34_01175 [Gemmatimonadota bacterium]
MKPMTVGRPSGVPARLGSVTRIADLGSPPFQVERIPTEDWAFADYVLARVRHVPHGFAGGFELPSGRGVTPMTGDLLVGALSRRFATLEATGSFEAVGEDGVMHLLTDAGCFGALTSRSLFSPALLEVEYEGHLVTEAGKRSNMRDWARPHSGTPFDMPVVLIVGTSMSAGKTHAGRLAVRALKELGHTVVGAKLTGAGRRRDVLAFEDAGADAVCDFMDAGLPTTVCPPAEYRVAVDALLSNVGPDDATVAVVEAGASPLEPYNGATLVELLGERVVYTVLCASDPYAVEGIRVAWDRDFDLVAGPAANTAAGIQLVRKLTGLHALDLTDEASMPELQRWMSDACGAGPGAR